MGSKTIFEKYQKQRQELRDRYSSRGEVYLVPQSENPVKPDPMPHPTQVFMYFGDKRPVDPDYGDIWTITTRTETHVEQNSWIWNESDWVHFATKSIPVNEV